MKQVHLTIPVGTKVLTRADGRVGVVVIAPFTPGEQYRARFANGTEEHFRRDELTIFKHTDSEIPDEPDQGALMR